MNARRLVLALCVALLAFGCSPRRLAETAEYAESCWTSKPVRECLAEFTCLGPDKPCIAALTAYTLACAHEYCGSGGEAGAP